MILPSVSTKIFAWINTCRFALKTVIFIGNFWWTRLWKGSLFFDMLCFFNLWFYHQSLQKSSPESIHVVSLWKRLFLSAIFGEQGFEKVVCFLICSVSLIYVQCYLYLVPTKYMPWFILWLCLFYFCLNCFWWWLGIFIDMTFYKSIC